MSLWSGEDFVRATGGRPVGSVPAEIGGISIDTRSLAKGDAFFAIRGDRFDGHDFATAAMVAEASVLVIAESKLAALGRVSTPLIVVDDVLKSLEKVGAAARARTGARIIAVTGSAGKTTTKEALRAALAPSGKVHAADKSFNNHWGVPLTLARMPADTDFAVFELGMNHPGEIRALSALVRPHIAVVTLVAAAHLGHFHSLDDIARAKGEIFEGVEPDGHAVINRDDHRWRILDGLAKKAGVKHRYGFGEHSRATFRLSACELTGDHSVISIRIGEETFDARIGAPGRHMVQNALAVLGTAHLAGADVAKAAAALANLSAEKGRGARHRLAHGRGSFLLIDESYNANPASMKAALDLLASSEIGKGGRRIAVLGEMRELGSHSEALHAELAAPIVEAGVDLLLIGGPEMRVLGASLGGKPPLEYRETPEEIADLLAETVRPGDAIMVKSSNGAGFSRVVDRMLSQFSRAESGR